MSVEAGQNKLIQNPDHERLVSTKMSDSKQSLTRSQARQAELENLAFDLGQLAGRGFIFSVADYSGWVEEFREAWAAEEGKDPIDVEGLLVLMRKLSADHMAELILHVNVGQIRQGNGSASVSVKELAAFMGIGVATLYRTYGKIVLQKFLSLGANENLSSGRTEKIKANESKFGGGFGYRDHDDDGDSWDENQDQDDRRPSNLPTGGQDADDDEK